MRVNLAIVVVHQSHRPSTISYTISPDLHVNRHCSLFKLFRHPVPLLPEGSLSFPKWQELGTHDLHSLSLYEVPPSFEANFICLPQKMETRLQADVKKARLLISLKRSICTFDLLQLLFVHTGSNGAEFMFLLKGHEDLRQDERVVQLFGLVNTLLAGDQETSKRHLGYVFSSV